jgi:peptide/nickel transport system permease protein
MAAVKDTALAPEFTRAASQRARPVRAVTRFLRTKPLGAVGAAIVTLILLCAVLAPAVAPYAYDKVNFSSLLQSPNGKHLFGTDENGRDTFSRILYGSQVTVIVGFGSVLLTGLLSTLIGVVSGYFGGRTDMIVQRFVDVWMSFPAIFLLLTLVAVLGSGGGGLFGIGRGPDFGPEIRGIVTIIALGVILAGGASRVVRSAVLGVKANAYIEAAHAIGSGNLRIIFQHILPNIFPVIIVLSTLYLGAAVLAEATISFLGFGIPPPFPTWGQMLAGRARELGPNHPWLVIFPGVAIFLAVYGFNMLGDALRDVLDPRLRGSR